MSDGIRWRRQEWNDLRKRKISLVLRQLSLRRMCGRMIRKHNSCSSSHLSSLALSSSHALLQPLLSHIFFRYYNKSINSNANIYHSQKLSKEGGGLLSILCRCSHKVFQSKFSHFVCSFSCWNKLHYNLELPYQSKHLYSYTLSLA